MTAADAAVAAAREFLSTPCSTTSLCHRACTLVQACCSLWAAMQKTSQERYEYLLWLLCSPTCTTCSRTLMSIYDLLFVHKIDSVRYQIQREKKPPTSFLHRRGQSALMAQHYCIKLGSETAAVWLKEVSDGSGGMPCIRTHVHTYLQRETKSIIWKTREIPDFTDTGELVSPML